MLEALANLIGTTMLSFTGYYAMSKIIEKKIKMDPKKVLVIILVAIVTVSLLKIKSTGIYTVVVILLNIIMYRYIFEITIEEAILSNSILWVNMFISDLVITQILCLFATVEQITTTPLMIILANTLVCILIIAIVNIKPIIKTQQKFYINNKKGIVIINIIFLVLLLVGFSLLAYNIATAYSWGSDYITNSIVMIIFMIITSIYIQSKNKYNQLTDEYDNLFSYVQNFEEWIEQEQFNRHEYKNQLAVLRYLTKEKKVKDKIDEILKDNINLEGNVINELKDLPRGGIKGLIYYKSIIAKKNKIKLTLDVSIKETNYLRKLKEPQIRDLCKLIGVYFDNAIEAAADTRKKQVTIEIYEMKGKTKIVFSNTFKKGIEMKRRNEKGYSTKGLGRGNGLYFANKLINKNKWLKQRQTVIDNYYIQEIVIDKESSTYE